MSMIQAADLSSSVREAFNFSVDKFPLSGPDGMKTPWYGMFRSDTFEVVGDGSVTSRYVPHTTDDICALVDAAGYAFDGEIECKTHFRNGHYVLVEPTKENRVKVFGDNDSIWPRVVIRAGYDGKAFSATMGYYRDLCMNLHIPRMVSGTNVSIRHTSGLRGKMNDLINTFGILKQSWATITDVVHHWQNREVSMVSFLDRVYGQPDADSQRAVTIHKNRTEAIFKRLYRERMISGRPNLTEDFNVSLWEAFNAVQGYVQHEARTKKAFSGDFDRILKSSSDPAVYKAESLAFELSA